MYATRSLLSLLLFLAIASTAFGRGEQNSASLRERGTRTRPAARDAIIASRQYHPSVVKREYCPAGPRPSGTSCSCSISGQCSGLTINFGTDPNNCGNCGIRCAAGQSCASGFCTSKPVTFYFRIEGSDSEGTLFEGPITTSAHNIYTPSGGMHLCDGTNNNANPGPGGTPTTAIDDAARCAGFTYDGSWSNQFQDFFITRIGKSDSTGNQYWGVLRNRVFTPRGGCQEQPAAGEEVLWAFDAFGKAGFLSISGPATAERGVPIVYTVRAVSGNGGAETPIGGATVNGATTNVQGRVALTFNTAGTVSIKATRSDHIRSNRIDVQVIDGPA